MHYPNYVLLLPSRVSQNEPKSNKLHSQYVKKAERLIEEILKIEEARQSEVEEELQKLRNAVEQTSKLQQEKEKEAQVEELQQNFKELHKELERIRKRQSCKYTSTNKPIQILVTVRPTGSSL